MTPPDSTPRISASAFRQLLSGASDAGLGSLISTSSVTNDGDRVVITVSAREVRALTNWLTLVAESHRDTPITATVVPVSCDVATTDDAWMTEVTDAERSTPVGYARINIPSRNGKGGSQQ